VPASCLMIVKRNLTSSSGPMAAFGGMGVRWEVWLWLWSGVVLKEEMWSRTR
jgi:hypothetical protein